MKHNNRRYKFNLNKTMEECILQKHTSIHALVSKGNVPPVLKLNNSARIRNRIIDHAKILYVQANYWTESAVEDQIRADHYGVAVGHVLKQPLTATSFSIKQSAELLREVRNTYFKMFNA